VQALAAATFPNRTVCLLKLNANGMLPQPDGKALVPEGVDVMMCLGHFYAPELLLTRHLAAERSEVNGAHIHPLACAHRPHQGFG
jgi:hypothetical protein